MLEKLSTAGCSAKRESLKHCIHKSIPCVAFSVENPDGGTDQNFIISWYSKCTLKPGDPNNTNEEDSEDLIEETV